MQLFSKKDQSCQRGNVRATTLKSLKFIFRNNQIASEIILRKISLVVDLICRMQSEKTVY